MPLPLISDAMLATARRELEPLEMPRAQSVAEHGLSEAAAGLPHEKLIPNPCASVGRARNACGQTLERRPEWRGSEAETAVWLELGQIYHQVGDLAAAEGCYRNGLQRAWCLDEATVRTWIRLQHLGVDPYEALDIYEDGRPTRFPEELPAAAEGEEG